MSALLGYLIVLPASAQINQQVYFTGLARVEIKNSAANGEVYEGDTVSENRNTSGVTLFDLGVHIQPTDYFKATSIVRLRNEFGAFFGQGSSVELRQLKLEGLIAKSIKYELGDIDIRMTPFTVFNHEDSSFFESSLFSLRKDVANYENLNESSFWRLQGAKAKAILFWGDSSAVSEVGVFGVRSREAIDTIPNRFLVGGSVLNQYKGLGLGLNYVRFFEQKDVESQEASYANDVMSTSLSLKKETSAYAINWNSEAGISLFDRVLATGTKRNTNDGFLLSGLEGKLKKAGLKAGVKYRYVGPNFYSAAAQTLRIDNTAESALFTYQSQGTVIRDQLLLDRFSGQNYYNGLLSPSLMMYLPQYGNVLPYGEATPNRQGITASLSYKTSNNSFQLLAEGHFLQEVAGRYGRNLSQYKLGALLRLDSLLNFKKALVLKSAFRNEMTSSTVDEAIDFTTNLLDLGAQIEVIKHFSLLLGWKYLGIEGTEYLIQYNTLNEAETAQLTTWDEQQQWLAWGIQFDFSSKSFFTLHGNYMLFQNTLDGSSDYNINQYYLNYTLRF